MIACNSRAQASERLAAVAHGFPVCLLESKLDTRSPLFKATTELKKHAVWHNPIVLVGVFYALPSRDKDEPATQRKQPSGLEVWGFLRGQQVQLALEGGASHLHRSWCADAPLQIPLIHDDFDLHLEVENLGDRQVTLDDVDNALRWRLRLYAAVCQKPSTACHPHRAPLALPVDADALWMDRFSYLLFLNFVHRNEHLLLHPNAHAINLRAWQYAEGRVSQFRIMHGVEQPERLLNMLQGAWSGLERVPVQTLCSDADHGVSIRAWLDGKTEDLFRVPFEQATALVAARACLLQGGFAYVTATQLYKILSQAALERHQINHEHRVKLSRQGRLDDFFRDPRIMDACRRFEAGFSAWATTVVGDCVRSGATAAPVSSEDRKQRREHLRDLLLSTPECMTELAARAVGLSTREHNKFQDRSTFFQFLLRHNAPIDEIVPMLEAKVNISYDPSQVKREWQAQLNSLAFEQKRFANPRNKAPFRPWCSWIITAPKSTLVCPYARTLLQAKPSFSENPRELAKQAQAQCHKQWVTFGNAAAKNTAPADSPDEFTQRMLAERTRRRQSAIAV